MPNNDNNNRFCTTDGRFYGKIKEVRIYKSEKDILSGTYTSIQYTMLGDEVEDIEFGTFYENSHRELKSYPYGHNGTGKSSLDGHFYKIRDHNGYVVEEIGFYESHSYRDIGYDYERREDLIIERTEHQYNRGKLSHTEIKRIVKNRMVESGYGGDDYTDEDREEIDTIDYTYNNGLLVNTIFEFHHIGADIKTETQYTYKECLLNRVTILENKKLVETIDYAYDKEENLIRKVILYYSFDKSLNAYNPTKTIEFTYSDFDEFGNPQEIIEVSNASIRKEFRRYDYYTKLRSYGWGMKDRERGYI